MYCSPWGHRELDTAGRLNHNNRLLEDMPPPLSVTSSPFALVTRIGPDLAWGHLPTLLCHMQDASGRPGQGCALEPRPVSAPTIVRVQASGLNPGQPESRRTLSLCPLSPGTVFVSGAFILPLVRTSVVSDSSRFRHPLVLSLPHPTRSGPDLVPGSYRQPYLPLPFCPPSPPLPVALFSPLTSL